MNEKSPIYELLEDLVVFLAKESTGASEEENSAIFSLFTIHLVKNVNLVEVKYLIVIGKGLG